MKINEQIKRVLLFKISLNYLYWFIFSNYLTHLSIHQFSRKITKIILNIPVCPLFCIRLRVSCSELIFFNSLFYSKIMIRYSFVLSLQWEINGVRLLFFTVPARRLFLCNSDKNDSIWIIRMFWVMNSRL